MPKQTNERYRLFVAQAERGVVGNLRYGAQIERAMGVSIDEVLKLVSADRHKMASSLLRSAKRTMKAKPADYRSSISRAYYAMYHAARAVTFISYGGDDHQDHSKLSEKLPEDFPDFAKWRNKLRIARLARNKADYEPYPRKQQTLQVECTNILTMADEFLLISRLYLRTNGCAL